MNDSGIHLLQTIKAWGSERFKSVLQKELESLSIDQLPLQQGLRYSSVVVDKAFQVMVVNFEDGADTIKAKVIVFYNGIIAGCSCADDPTPVNEQTEQCELFLEINKQSGIVLCDLLG